MTEIATGLITALAANPAMLLLCVVIVGLGWLMWKIGGRLVEGTFSRLDKFDSRLESIEDALKEIIVVKKDVERLEEKVDKIEDACSRRHEK
jgi:hypothetical protein